MLDTPKGNLVELFWSVQGEGPWVGQSTIFVRFAGCDLRCAWCDSPETWKAVENCRFERAPGTAEFEFVVNPVSADQIMLGVQNLNPRPGTFLCLTGGEPLLQPKLVEAVARRSREHGLRTYLETHGLHTESLARVIKEVDVVAMDWKLPSDVRPADREGIAPADFGKYHRAFLEIATAGSEVAVKVVLTCRSEDHELESICESVAEVAPHTTLILQPVTPFGATREAVGADRLLQLMRLAEEQLSDVRLIPQTHKVYGAL